MAKSLKQSKEDLDKAWFDFIYQLFKAIGVIKLANMIPFLELRQWVKDREVKDV